MVPVVAVGAIGAAAVAVFAVLCFSLVLGLGWVMGVIPSLVGGLGWGDPPHWGEALSHE